MRTCCVCQKLNTYASPAATPGLSRPGQPPDEKIRAQPGYRVGGAQHEFDRRKRRLKHQIHKPDQVVEQETVKLQVGRAIAKVVRPDRDLTLQH